jgi:hypothetical protein
MAVNQHDMAGGGLLVAVGSWFSFHALTKLELGTTLQMGPGYFPALLGAILAIFGLIVVFKAFGHSTPVLVRVPWRAVILVSLAPVLFGVTARGLGIAPATMIAALVAAYSSRLMKFKVALPIALCLTTFCVLVFSYGLGLPLPLLGPWLTF